MTLQENVSLATLTTLRVGGAATYVATCESEEDVHEAVALAHKHGLPFSVLGEGSNVLAHDEGYEGVVILMRIPGVTFFTDAGATHVRAGAGISWDTLVQEAAGRGLWGIENLAGIPGTVGAAPVQNIGAYGMELIQTFLHAEVLDTRSNEQIQVSREDAAFGYRDSRFKHEPSLIVLGATFLLSKEGSPQVGYADLAGCISRGEDLTTPLSIGEAVRRVRSQKFPDRSVSGTAGSFFKNPIITHDQHRALAERFGAVPSFPVTRGVKVPLAFILDRVLGLRGYREGKVSLFGNQPLVLVADAGATAKEIDTFAKGIAKRVYDATGIVIEREVRNFPEINL